MLIKNKLNLLIISGYYPPTISIASNRILAFSKYLDVEKFNITVITFGDDSGFIPPKGIDVIRINDQAFFSPLPFNKPHGFIIHKTKVVYNILIREFFGNQWKTWQKAVFRYIVKNYDKNAFDFVISSFAPEETHLVALQLKQQGYNFKWIADMRDEMSRNLSLAESDRKKLKKIEERIFKEALAISSTAQVATENFKKSSAKYQLDCFEVKNGYDFELPKTNQRNNVFTMSHIGSFYGKRKPDLFLKAVAQLLKSDQIKDIKIRFIGIAANIPLPLLLKDKVEISQKIPHQKALEMMQESDANLLIIAPAQKGAIPGKIYEYMACLKPIIGIFDEKLNQQTADILKQSGLAYLSAFSDLEALKAQLLKLYKDWKENDIQDYNIEYIQQFHRKAQVKIMEKYILQHA